MAADVAIYTSGVFSTKEIELISIALDASYTHIYAFGTRRHIKAALKGGAAVEEIMEVLKVCVAQGVQSCNLRVPILAEELSQLSSASESAGSYNRRAKRHDLRGNWLNLRGVFHGDVRCGRQPASELAVVIREAFEGHIFLSHREIACQVISHHLSQATVVLVMSTNRLLAHEVLLLQHREQTASSIFEQRNERPN
jgi:hypothetical protein